MKKLIILIGVMFLNFTLYASIISYTPSISVNGGMNFTVFNENVEKTHTARANAALGVNADVLSMTFIDQHRISIPVAFSYDFRSETVRYRIVQPRLSLSAMLEYGYQSKGLAGISIASGPRVDWFYQTNSASLALDNTLTLSLKPVKYMSIEFPLTLSLSKLGYEVDLRCSIKLHLDSFFRGEEK